VIVRKIIFAAVVFLLLARPSLCLGQTPDPLPPGDGHDLVAVACSQCHFLSTIAKIRDGAPGWRLYVNNMVLRGAQLTPAEVDTVVNYLALNLGPGINLPPAKPASLPAGEGKQLVETRCALCHDLDRVAMQRRKTDWPVIVANMIEQGAPVTADESRAISDYLAANFGK
jgi:Quinohemoprotein amine dehydrogenase A, alpha subunit, haem binding